MLSATGSLFAFGVPLTPKSAIVWGGIYLGLSGLLALVALIRRRHGTASRLLTVAAVFGSFGLCLAATAEALRREAGWMALLAVWAVFPLLVKLAGALVARVPLNRVASGEAEPRSDDRVG